MCHYNGFVLCVLLHTKTSQLTGLLEDGAPLVAGGSETWSTDIVETGLVNASIEHTEEWLFLFPLGHDFVVDEGGKHLCFDEVGQEGEVGLRLV